MSKHHSKLALLLILGLLCISNPSLSVAAATNERYFPATGHSVVGKFLAYWDAHGGLAQFGYPISEEFTEVSAIDGKSYGVQYFERAEFEHHPENAAPYDVELAQLGTMRYQQIYPNGANGQQANTSNPYTFAETGKTIGGAFRAYWEQNGGLAQFGYPISNEFQEVSALNGQSYTVQYFERAEFEYHPEVQPYYNVLLSQLGKFRYDGKYHLDLFTPYMITMYVSSPIVAGNYVFWMVLGTGWIYGYDLETQYEFLVTKGSGSTHGLASNGTIVVWVEDDSINAYDLKTGNTYTISSDASPYSDPALDEDTLYYNKAGGYTYALDLTSRQEHRIGLGGEKYIVNDGILLWNDITKDGSIGSPIHRLHLASATGGITDTIVTTSSYDIDFSGYGVAGDSVVWSYDVSSYTLLDPEIVEEYKGVYLYRISSGYKQLISSDIAYNPVISDQRVFWTNNGTIKEYGLDNGATTTIVSSRGDINRAIGIANQNTLIFSKTVPTSDGLVTALYSVNIP